MIADSFHIKNPISYHPLDLKHVGIFGIMTMMSEHHYGLIVFMDKSAEFADMDIEEMREDIAVPIICGMPSFVQAYQQYFRDEIKQFPKLDMDTTFNFCIVPANELSFALPNGATPGSADGVPTQFLYIAPSAAVFDEFVVLPSALN